MLFSNEQDQVVIEQEEIDNNDNDTDQLFDQDTKEDEDFEIPAFLRRQKFLMPKLKINEHSNNITGILPFSSDAE